MYIINSNGTVNNNAGGGSGSDPTKLAIANNLSDLDDVTEAQENLGLKKTITINNISANITHTDEVFNNVYLNYNVASVTLDNCEFQGVCYIKNTYGTIIHSGSKGGYVISNKAIPDNLIGTGEVPATDF